MSTGSRFGLGGVQVWPTMLFTRLWERHDQESPSILQLISNLRHDQRSQIESNVAVGAKSGKGLYESDFDFFSRTDGCLQKLVRFIESTLRLAVSIANQREASPDDILIQFVDSWYHVTNDGGFHDAHVHHGCSWCGIYYLQIGQSGKRMGNSAPNGGSRFYCPFQLGGGYRDFGNKYLTGSIDPPIESGMLLLFPSYLMHSGLPYLGNEDRVVLAFNAQAHLVEGSPSAKALQQQ